MAPGASGSYSFASCLRLPRTSLFFSLRSSHSGSISGVIFLLPFYSSKLPYSEFPHNSSFLVLLFFSETLPISFSSEFIRNYPFKIESYQDPKAKSLISYIPWIKAELRATVKDFSKPSEETHRVAEELSIVSQTYEPGFSDLYQMEISSVGKDTSRRPLFSLTGKLPIRYC